ncbi:MAG: ABC transporter permease [Deltaproteobacteria bacterium]|nr:ABC transporter permease [Deltaproteobacteria bacterium]
MKVLRAIPLVVVAAFFCVALVGPLLAPYGHGELDIAQEFASPSASHVLGTGENGIDLLSALLRGTRLAFVVAASVVLVSVVVGVGVGIAAGYLGGTIDRAASAVITLLLAFPSILLNMAIVALVARPGVGHIIFALCVNGWVSYARVARGETLAIRSQEYVKSGVSLGLPLWRIALGHILPNLAGPVIIQATYGFGGVILAESSLSFLGLGPARADSWGALLDQGASYLMVSPWVALVSGAAIFVCILSFNLLGDEIKRRVTG